MTSPSLLQLYTPIFTLVSTIEINRNQGAPEEVRAKTVQLLRSVGESSQISEKQASWVRDAQYAVAALVDESIMRSHWHGRDQWKALPLCTALGMTPNPGVHFYERLDYWLNNSKPPTELLEVYFVCLGLGYQGRHFENAATLSQYKRSLLKILCGNSQESNVLSPNADRKADDVLRADSERFPWLWILIGSTASLLVMFLVLRLVLNSLYSELLMKLSSG